MSTRYDTIVVGCGASGVVAAVTLARAGRRVLAVDAQSRVGGRVCTVPFGDGVVELGAECSSTMSTRYDTIVVGCGASGVVAAVTLARAGRRVLAVDAQSRVGGRVCTVPFGDGVVELGAEWIHGTIKNRVHDTAIAAGISVKHQDLEMSTWRSDGGPADQTLVNELIGRCLEVAEDHPPGTQPLGQYITKRLIEYLRQNKPHILEDKDFIEQFLAFLDLFIDNYEASDSWNDVSACSRYTELEGHQHASWHRHGYKTYFETLLNTYNGGNGIPNLEIKLDTEVTNIGWSPEGGPVYVRTAAGARYEADNVIVTVSLGVLKEKHKTLFTPSLPSGHVNAIEKLSIGVMDKIILSFPHAWWPKDKQFFAFIWRGKDKDSLKGDWTTRIFGASTPLGSSNTMTLWTNGEVSKLVESLPEDVVKRKCVALLRRFLGRDRNVPEPTGIVLSRWYTNPYTRGSYTYDNLLTAEHPNTRSDLARPLSDKSGKLRILFAGEATHDIYFSTVHGAAETGYREAMRLLRGTSKI